MRPRVRAFQSITLHDEKHISTVLRLNSAQLVKGGDEGGAVRKRFELRRVKLQKVFTLAEGSADPEIFPYIFVLRSTLLCIHTFEGRCRLEVTRNARTGNNLSKDQLN